MKTFKKNHKLEEEFGELPFKPCKISKKIKKMHRGVLFQWAEKMGFKMKNKHLLLGHDDLDEVSKLIIKWAQEEIIIFNPYVEDISTANSLIDAKKDNLQVILVTRTPYSNDTRKIKFHKKLRNNDIKIFYIDKVHAKAILVDQAVTIISSMNFTPHSSSGSSWELGVVSTDEEVVNDSFTELLRFIELNYEIEIPSQLIG